jgi:microcystin degradation protein MlrC
MLNYGDSMRVYIAGVQHECSSFSPIPASRRSFTTVRWGADPRVLTLGLGYGESCEVAIELGFDLVAGPFSWAQPSSPAADSVWHQIRDGILDGLRAAGPLDIVLLCLHGAQMSDRQHDCEGELLDEVRQLVGDSVAVGCLLDLHANVSMRMLNAADLVVSCREYPHIDYDKRALEMLPVLARIRRGDVRPTTAAVRFMAPGVYPTPEEPMKSFNARFTEMQRRGDALMVSVNHGFQGSDQPDLSASVVVTTDDDHLEAERLALEVAGDFLEVVSSRRWSGPDVEAAVIEAFGFVGRPVVLADRADNAGGGAASDSTFVLAELIRRNARDVALALLWDPVAVDSCHDAGVGAVLPLRIGGKCGPMSGDPLDVHAEVINLRHDAAQALYGKGEAGFSLGRSVAIRVGGVGGIEVVMNSVRNQVFSHHVFSDHGIDYLARHVLVVKSTQHFMNDFGRFAAHVIRCDGPGTLTANLSQLPYRHVRRPLLGLDPVDRVELEPMSPIVRRHRRAS